jgi:hypothetical protein
MTSKVYLADLLLRVVAARSMPFKDISISAASIVTSRTRIVEEFLSLKILSTSFCGIVN